MNYLAAIDVPLSPLGTAMAGGVPHTLATVSQDSRRSLYVRARALAAFAMLSPPEGVALLTAVAHNDDQPAPLRAQAVTSLARTYGSVERALVTSTLIELLATGVGFNATVERELHRVLKRRSSQGQINDSR